MCFLYLYRLIVVLRAARRDVHIPRDVELLRKYTGPRFSVTFSIYGRGSNFHRETFNVGCFEEHQVDQWNNYMTRQHYELMSMFQAILHNGTQLRIELHSQNQINAGPVKLM